MNEVAGSDPGRPLIEAILFDLGGVLVELKGVPRMREWMDWSVSEDELWRRWLLSPTVRAFETGRSTPDQFASGMISEFSLPVDEDQFLKEYTSWPVRLYPGTESLLRELAGKFILGSLTNTNVLHWHRLRDEMGLGHLLEHNFPSHETGLLKPDREGYLNAARSMDCAIDRILFLDDNQMNVDGAASVGMVSRRAMGIAGTMFALTELGLLGRMR